MSDAAEALRIILDTDKPVLVSACLIGAYCRYDGTCMAHPAAMELLRQGRALPVCPELFGGLSVPRPACERLGELVVNKEGRDVTTEFRRGAGLCLDMARLAGCAAALLKARSPSCGPNLIYDGTFSGVRIPGDGVFAEMLKAAGLPLATELDMDES